MFNHSYIIYDRLPFVNTYLKFPAGRTNLANSRRNLQDREDQCIEYLVNPAIDNSKIQQTDAYVIYKENRDNFSCNFIPEQFTAEKENGDQ